MSPKRQLKKWIKRLREITELEISRRPYDPALCCEIGVLNVRLGNPDVGYRWLLQTLSLDANYQPAQAALAEYYAKQGDADRAASHRQHVQEASSR